jgi:protein-S-isoprenylcysteine O-methyltransferase Ste14
MGGVGIEDMVIGLPTKIVSGGPYAFSRNPMCVAWTWINLGIALAASTPWTILFLLGAVNYTHVFLVPREERDLEEVWR